jgi:hypothetical protein
MGLTISAAGSDTNGENYRSRFSTYGASGVRPDTVQAIVTMDELDRPSSL